MTDSETNNPVVDDVRRIRRQIVEQYGHDLDRLAAELRQIETEYAERRGIFATVTTESATKVVSSWGAVSAPPEEGSVDDVRRVRQRIAEGG
jgi:hypothetical protein